MNEHKITRYKSRESYKNIYLPSNGKINFKSNGNNLIRELDDIEIYEWAHLKILKANRFLKKKKYDEVIDFLLEIINGIESKHGEETETNSKMQTRLQEEIKLPSLKKLRSLFYNKKKFQEALQISEKVQFLKK